MIDWERLVVTGIVNKAESERLREVMRVDPDGITHITLTYESTDEDVSAMIRVSRHLSEMG